MNKKFSIFIMPFMGIHLTLAMNSSDNNNNNEIPFKRCGGDIPLLWAELHCELRRPNKNPEKVVSLSEQIRIFTLANKPFLSESQWKDWESILLSLDGNGCHGKSFTQITGTEDRETLEKNLDTFDELTYPVNLLALRLKIIEYAKQSAHCKEVTWARIFKLNADAKEPQHTSEIKKLKLAILEEEEKKTLLAYQAFREAAPETFPDLGSEISIKKMLRICKEPSNGIQPSIHLLDTTQQKAVFYYLFVAIKADLIWLEEEYKKYINDFFNVLAIRFENKRNRLYYRWILSAIRFAQAAIEDKCKTENDDLSWVEFLVGKEFVKKYGLPSLTESTLKATRLGELEKQKEEAIDMLYSYEKRKALV